MLLQGQRHYSDELKEGRLLSEGRQCADGYGWVTVAIGGRNLLRRSSIYADTRSRNDKVLRWVSEERGCCRWSLSNLLPGRDALFLEYGLTL